MSLAADLGRFGIRANAVAAGTAVTDRVKQIYAPEQLVERGKLSANPQHPSPKLHVWLVDVWHGVDDQLDQPPIADVQLLRQPVRPE